MVEKEFDLGKLLGEGNYAQVKLGKEKSTGHMWAVKIINKKKLEPGDEEMLALEVGVLSQVTHPNVVHLYKTYDTKYKMYLVLELVTGGELLERLMALGAYTEQDACDLFAKVMHAVEYLHDRGIAHRDLKPENLLLANPGDPASIKIADFGFAKVVGDLKKDANGAQLMMTSCGTPEYVAPEVLKNVGYGVSCDIWSMGIILYIMLCGFPPFYNESMPKLFDDIMKKPHEYPSPEWDPISDDAKDLLNQMMAKDPAQRCTANACIHGKWVHEPNELVPLEQSAAQLKKFMARRNLRKGIEAVEAISFMQHMVHDHQAAAE